MTTEPFLKHHDADSSSHLINRPIATRHPAGISVVINVSLLSCVGIKRPIDPSQPWSQSCIGQHLGAPSIDSSQPKTGRSIVLLQEDVVDGFSICSWHSKAIPQGILCYHDTRDVVKQNVSTQTKVPDLGFGRHPTWSFCNIRSQSLACHRHWG